MSKSASEILARAEALTGGWLQDLAANISRGSRDQNHVFLRTIKFVIGPAGGTDYELEYPLRGRPGSTHKFVSREER
jgi:hypothetical protein